MFNGSDRFYARYGGGGHTESLLVGCVLTGGKAAPPSHSDTIQIASDGTGGSGFVTVRDSVLWPSWDKVLQGEGSTYQFDLDNTWVVSPTKATSLWNGMGPGTINFTQPYHTTGRSTYSNSTLVGDCFPDRVNVTASDLYQSGQCISDGGNTNLSSAEYPPPVARPTPSSTRSGRPERFYGRGTEPRARLESRLTSLARLGSACFQHAYDFAQQRLELPSSTRQQVERKEIDADRRTATCQEFQQRAVQRRPGL